MGIDLDQKDAQATRSDRRRRKTSDGGRYPSTFTESRCTTPKKSSKANAFDRWLIINHCSRELKEFGLVTFASVAFAFVSSQIHKQPRGPSLTAPTCSTAGPFRAFLQSRSAAGTSAARSRCHGRSRPSGTRACGAVVGDGDWLVSCAPHGCQKVQNKPHHLPTKPRSVHRIDSLDVEAVGLGRGALVLRLELDAAGRLRLPLLLEHVRRLWVPCSVVQWMGGWMDWMVSAGWIYILHASTKTQERTMGSSARISSFRMRSSLGSLSYLLDASTQNNTYV